MIKLLLKELDLILWVYITRSVFKDEHSTKMNNRKGKEQPRAFRQELSQSLQDVLSTVAESILTEYDSLAVSINWRGNLFFVHCQRRIDRAIC